MWTGLMWSMLRHRISVQSICGRKLDTMLAIVAPSYGIGRDGNLTQASMTSTKTSLDLWNAANRIPAVMLASALGTRERELKVAWFHSASNAVWVVGTYTTYDETAGFLKAIAQLGLNTAAVVGENTHLPRALLAFNLLDPAVHLIAVPFKAPMEPFVGAGLKGWTNQQGVWELFNLVAFLATPRLVQKYVHP